MDKDKDKFKEYIDLCTSSFLIKMINENDESYFFKAYKSNYNEKTTVLKFKLSDIDPVNNQDIEHYREINLNTGFGNDFEKLKAVIIPEHKDMYKDIVTDGIKVDCPQDNCGGDALKKEYVVPALPERNKPPLILKPNIGSTNIIPGPEAEEKARKIRHNYSMGGKGKKKKKKRRKKSSRSKKRRNKRNNRTKKN